MYLLTLITKSMGRLMQASSKLFILSILLCLGFVVNISAQDSTYVARVLRINFMSPAFEIEIPTGKVSTFSAELGIGYNGSYPELTVISDNGINYIIAPTLDLQHKWFYNFSRRKKGKRQVTGNSANFLSFRFVTRGPSIAENVIRTSDYDFAFGPTWGIQRRYGEHFHLLFDVGPQYYFDTEGNSGIFPVTAQINLGFDL